MNVKKILLILVLVLVSSSVTAWDPNPLYNPFEIIWNYIGNLSTSWKDGIDMVTTDVNVGIGTHNPTEKLEVNGNMKVNGSVVDDAASGKNLIPNWQMESDDEWADPPEQTIVADPNGVNHYAHHSAESGVSCYEQAISPLIPTDPSKLYKASIWIKSTETDLYNYFGFYLYDSKRNKITGDWNNRYFKINKDDPNVWKKWTAYLGPSYAGGVSDCESDKTNGKDYCMASNTAYIQLRFMACYGDGSNSGHTYYMYPKLEEIDPDDSGIVGDFTVMNGNVGIGTSSPSAKLDVEVSSGGAATIGSSGNSATGDYAVAMGYGTDASEGYSTAMGLHTTASGGISTAMGSETTASGLASTAMGSFTTASGPYSTAIGVYSTASGSSSTAMGYDTTSSGDYSTAMGSFSTASGSYSIAMGRRIEAAGQYSFGIGLDDTPRTIALSNIMAIMGGNVGIGTASPDAKLEVSSVIKSTPTDSPGTCNSGLEGGMYYDASLNEPCFCDGTNWKQFDGGGNC